MAVILPDKLYVGGAYLDANISVADITELSQKALSNDFFLGMEVKMPEAFYSVNEIPYPIDFWSTPYGEDIKWEIKTVPTIENETDLENFKEFVDEFKTVFEYYPLQTGTEFLVGGKKYLFNTDEEGSAIYSYTQDSLDELINHTVELAVEEAVNKVTSGATDAFDTLKEIEEWINANSGNTNDLTGYVKQEDLEGYAKVEDIPSIEGLATKDYVDSAVNEIVIPSLDEYATKEWVGAEIAKIEVPSLEGYATEAWVGEQGFLTEHQDISGLATKEEVANAIAEIEIPSVEGLATEQFVADEIAKIEIPSLEGLASEAWVGEQGFLTEHQDISGLATKEEVADAISKIEVPSLEGYATESWVSAEIAKAQLEGEDIDLSGYATKDDIKGLASEQFVTDRISEIQIPSIDGLATETYVDEKVASINIPSIEGLATEAWVNEQGFLTEHQDITGKQDVIEDLEAIREGAAKGATALQEVPEGYATETWVGEQGFLTEHQDISGLATKEEVANAIAEIEIPSVEGLATEQFVTDEIAKIEIPSIDHLATKEELSVVSGSIKSVIEDLLIPENAKETLDTLEEISTWIQSHPDDAASMNAQIVALQASAHTHDNKGVLDGITAEKVAAWDTAEDNAKGYTDDEIEKLSDVYAKKIDLEGLATETWVSAEIAKAQLEGEDIDLSGYATKDDIKGLASEQFVTDEIAKIEIPTLDGYATEAWVGEQGFLTEHQDITGKQDVIEDLEVIREGAAKGATALQEVPEGYATEAWVGEQGFLTEHQDITGKQDVIDDLEAIREGAAKGATALQEVPEGYATETWVGEQGFLTEHQDISGLATKDEVSDAVLSAQTYADGLVENLKPYNGGIATDVVDYAVNVNVAEDGFLKVNEENELTVTGVTLDAAVTSKDITIEGGQWATAVKTVFTGGTVPAGTTWQSFLESMLCVEKFDTSYSMSKTFTVTCGTLGEGISGASNNTSVEVGTKVSLKAFDANPTTASQSFTVSTFDYGYKIGEDGSYNKNTSYKEDLTPSLKESNDALTATFTTFVDESGNTIAKMSGNTSMEQVDMRVMDGTNKVVIAQTGDTYTSSSAVTAGTIYVATNLKNYYKADKKTPNTYEPKVSSEDKTATASTTYTVTGYRNTFYGTTSKTDAADATFIRTLNKSNKAIAAGNTISFETKSSDGHLRMVIASPRTIKSVKNSTGTQDLTAILNGTKTVVNVGGVDNFAPISYNVYDNTWKGAFGDETWIITFA